MRKLIEHKSVDPVEMNKGDTLQVTWKFKTSWYQRGDKKVFTHLAEQRMTVDTIQLWYVENEFGLTQGYACTFGRS